MKLALAFLALSSFAFAQTPAPTPAKPVAPHAAAASSGAKSTTPLPKVVGLPHTLYTLKYVDIKIGTGPIPEPMRFYTVNYTGYLPDGTKFDSTIDPTFKHPTPFTFPYGGHRVITGWDTGFEGMRVGGKRRLFVPYQLGYGLAGSPPKIPAKTNLIFDVELISFTDKPPTPPGGRPMPPGAGGAPGGMVPRTPPAGASPAPGAPATSPAPASSTPPASGTSAPATSSPAAPATPPPASAPVKPVPPPTK